MGRLPRPRFNGAFYHVFSRGNRRETLFHDAADYQKFLDVLFDQSARLEVHLYSWCPMPNHFHLALETPHANLSSFMQRLLTAYARYYNRRYKKVGHVFQGRFGSKIVDREEYLLELVRYIHLNPYRVKKRGWTMPRGGWPWSSHPYYRDGNEPSVAAPFIHAVLRRFSDRPEQARQRYLAFIKDGLASKKQADTFQEEGACSGAQTRWVAPKPSHGSSKMEYPPSPACPDLQTLLRVTAAETNQSIERIVSKGRGRDIAEARQIFVFIAVRLWKQNQAAVATALRKDASTISHLLKRSTITRDSPQVQTILINAFPRK